MPFIITTDENNGAEVRVEGNTLVVVNPKPETADDDRETDSDR